MRSRLQRADDLLARGLGGLSVPLWCIFSRPSSPPQRHRQPQRLGGRRALAWLVLALPLIIGFHFFASTALRAKEAQPNEDPQIAQRMKNLTEQLRCLVCQSEALSDSPSEWAETVRREIRDQMKAGKSDQEIIAFLTQRYGDKVLYKPPVKSTTYLLWFGPFVLLILGTFVLYRFLQRRRQIIQEKPLTADERKRAEEILKSV